MGILIRTVILIASAAIFFTNINNFPLRNWDEAWYAEIIKNMTSGHYSFLVPFWNGQYYFDKPPLYFWLSMPLFKIYSPPLDAGEWQARIVSASAAAITVLLVYLIAQRIFKRSTAILSVIIFLTLGQVVIRFAHGNLDALVVCLILASLYFYIAPWKLSRLAAAFSLSLTYLAKGWIFGLLPIFSLFLFEYFLLGKNFKKIIKVFSLSVLFVSPYYILGYKVFGREFINWYLFNPTASLFAPHSFSLQFLTNLIRDIGFWFIPIIFSLAPMLTIERKDKSQLLILAFAASAYLLGISFISQKLGWYALPVYPFVSIAAAYFIERLFSKKFALALISVIIAAILQIYNISRIENIYPDRSKIGAELGKAAAKIVPSEDLLILDDHDLPSFLYYSNHKTVYVLSAEDNKPSEWWVLKYAELPNLLSSQKSAWIITRNPNIAANAHIETEVEGYKFLKVANN